MSFSDAFPDDILDQIRQYPGNDKCCDCTSFSTDWASVSHGTLICLDCAGKHRSLGVQIQMMVQGGNGQVKRFFNKIGIENGPIQSVYTTKGASHYREKLKERVEKVMSGELSADRRSSLKAPTQIETESPSSSKKSDLTPPQDEYYDAAFGVGTMGMTLTKHRGKAVVSKLVSGGMAQSNGIKVGDYIVCVAGIHLEGYDDIMHKITTENRPVVIRFARYQKNSPKRTDPRDHLHHSYSATSFPAPNELDMEEYSHGVSERVDFKKLSPSDKTSSDPIAPFDGPSPRSSSSKSNRTGFSIEEQHSNSDTDISKNLKKARSLVPPLQPISPLNQATLPFKSLSLSSETKRIPSSEKLIKGNSSPSVHKSGLSSKSVHYVNNSVLPIPPASSDVIHIYCDTNKSDLDDGQPIFSQKILSPKNLSGDSKKNNYHDLVHIISKIDESLNDLEKNPLGKDLDSNDNDPVLEELEVSFEEKLRNIIEVGEIFKVYRLDELKWRTAIIKRIHKDGTFKVIYRDGTSESHVPASRIAIPASRLHGKFNLYTPQAPASMRYDSNESDQSPTERLISKKQKDLTEIQFEEVQNALDNISMEKFNQDLINSHEAYVIGSNEILESWGTEHDPKEDPFLFTEKSNDSNDSNISNHIDLTSPQKMSSLAKLIEVTFPKAPLGITLSANTFGEPEISRIRAGGQAEKLDLFVGDIFTFVDKNPVKTYEEAMNCIAKASFPLTITIKRKLNQPITPDVSPLIAANKNDEIYSIDIQKLPVPASTEVSSKTNLRNPTDTTKKKLPLIPSNSLEFDVTITTNELGFDVDEKLSDGTTIVTDVMDNTFAKDQGLAIGCIIVGINYEPYISYAHTFATLKRGKRPLIVRFRRKNG